MGRGSPSGDDGVANGLAASSAAEAASCVGDGNALEVLRRRAAAVRGRARRRVRRRAAPDDGRQNVALEGRLLSVAVENGDDVLRAGPLHSGLEASHGAEVRRRRAQADGEKFTNLRRAALGEATDASGYRRRLSKGRPPRRAPGRGTCRTRSGGHHWSRM